ncbi:hypothetical protein [Chryseobacterium cheonjiense]|uniref:Uncharacterized protein n=1 Tax=Chryseobacterium cheonjiense TaxID=2728845 RepID=A0A7Y0A6W4_9FLAO|nr:hypothetical protein [Chryseobacterium cheonjiense]NML57710.1 hypothetical protein [Chryseobacterium cheonjiense]
MKRKIRKVFYSRKCSFGQGKIPMLGENPALYINDIGGPTIKLMEPELDDVFIDDIRNAKNIGEIKGIEDLENKIEII